MKIGYLISSHVVQNHAIIPPLLESMAVCGIDPGGIVVSVSGALKERTQKVRGVTFLFQTEEFTCYFQPVVEGGWGPKLGVTHWFFINGTSRCGSRFRELVEGGAVEDADVTLAGNRLRLGNCGSEGRAINDLCLYRDDYLHSQIEAIRQRTMIVNKPGGSRWEIRQGEGMLYALAPRKAKYPVIGHRVQPSQDVYGTGIARRVEYYPGIDWYRFKRNFGQLRPGTYDPALF